jgi:hypothetical protein
LIASGANLNAKTKMSKAKMAKAKMVKAKMAKCDWMWLKQRK